MQPPLSRSRQRMIGSEGANDLPRTPEVMGWSHPHHHSCESLSRCVRQGQKSLRERCVQHLEGSGEPVQQHSLSLNNNNQ